MIGRRTFLYSITGVGALAGLAGWRLEKATYQKAAIAVLRKRLSYLKLDETGLQRFADDLARRHPMSSFRMRILGAAGPLYSRIAPTGHGFISNGVRHGEERVVTLYLLSSDFFLNGRDETRIVHYIGYYDPFQACSSPFARPIVPSSGTPA